MTVPIRVLLADDHPLVRAGIRATLAGEGITIVGEATNSREAWQLCRDLQPDVLLLDLSMPGPSPFDTMRRLQEDCRTVRVVILSAYDDPAYVRGLAIAGVAGYVLKDEAPETVARAIRSVMDGGTWFSRSVMAKLVRGRPDTPGQGTIARLTDRERKLLQLLARGLDNARIAATLGLGEQTVRNYLSQLYAKIGVHSRAEAIAWTRDHDLGQR